ncbi:hypothetical protein X756_23065 [Mesorhizobium sp. LSHC412B00]|nr:hypothetical protein X756_23065 [Mesorhizobium sp. LSHC412B00]
MGLAAAAAVGDEIVDQALHSAAPKGLAKIRMSLGQRQAEIVHPCRGIGWPADNSAQRCTEKAADERCQCRGHDRRRIESASRQCPMGLLCFEIAGQRNIVTRWCAKLLPVAPGVVMPDGPLGRARVMHGILLRKEIQCEQSPQAP